MLQALPTFLAQVESDFSVPCACYRLCASRAEWRGRATHGVRCPADAFVCTACKDAIVSSWEAKLCDGLGFCSNCDGPVTGQLSDHLRFIKL